MTYRVTMEEKEDAILLLLAQTPLIGKEIHIPFLLTSFMAQKCNAKPIEYCDENLPKPSK